MNKPNISFLKTLIVSFTLASLLSACSSNAKTPTPAKDAALKLKTWNKLAKSSDARRVPGNRIQVTTDGTLLGKLAKIEDAFLIRAAAETLKANHDSFIIKYVDYEDSVFKWFSQPIETYPEAVNIWEYESFLIHSEEQNFFSSQSSKSQKRIQGVIALINSNDMPNGRYFDARETYETLIQERNLEYR